MNELALFAGAGGGILGGHLLGWRTVCAVEKEQYCREVLLRRQRDGVLPLFPIWDDCDTFDGKPWAGCVDIITAGFPCQPFSIAGKLRAGDDKKNGWPATVRILGEVRPEWALLENVPGLLAGAHGYFGEILGELASIGYDAVWDCFPASAVGAPHRRDRLWVLAHANGGDLRIQSGRRNGAHGPEAIQPPSNGASEPVADPRKATDRRSSARSWRKTKPGVGRFCDGCGDAWCELHETHAAICPCPGGTSGDVIRCPADCEPIGGDWWKTEPGVGRVVDELAHRLDQLRALGNGQVAAVVPLAFWSLMEKLRRHQ